MYLIEMLFMFNNSKIDNGNKNNNWYITKIIMKKALISSFWFELNLNLTLVHYFNNIDICTLYIPNH